MNSILKVIWNLVFNLTGLDISFGANYKDWTFYLIELRADYQRVKEMLAERQVVPREVVPGETRIQIVGCDMRDVQIVGSYQEVSIQVPVELMDEGPNEIYAHLYLPVTTEAARWPGVDITGFPKFIALIDIEKKESQIDCRLGNKDEPILEFRMDDFVGEEKKFIWEYYGNRKERIIKTTFELKGMVYEEEANPNAILLLGKHPISKTIRNLLLSDKVLRTVIGHNVSGFLRKPVCVEYKGKAS